MSSPSDSHILDPNIEWAPGSISIANAMRQVAACNVDPYKLSEGQLRDFIMKMADEVEEIEHAVGWNGCERRHGIPVDLLEAKKPHAIVRVKGNVLMDPGLYIGEVSGYFIPAGKVGYANEDSDGDWCCYFVDGMAIYGSMLKPSQFEIIEDLREQNTT